jgi:hypothetical protein
MEETPDAAARDEQQPRTDFGWGDPRVFEDERMRRRRIFTFFGILAAVLAGGFGVYALLGSSDGAAAPTTTTRAIAAVDGTTATLPVPEPVDLEWYAIDGSIGWADSVVADSDGTFYALSTAPGRAFAWPAPKALYRSTDGESWDAILLDDDIYARDMAIAGGTVYLISTAPSFGNPVEAPQTLVHVSDDAGDSWARIELPTEAAPPAGAQTNWVDATMRIAAGEHGVLAAVNTNFYVDYWSLLPQQLLTGERGTEETPDGIRIVDYMVYEQAYMECEQAMSSADDEIPEICRRLEEGTLAEAIIEEFTWADLGLSGPPSFSELFLSTDGETFEVIPAPFEGTRLGDLYATPLGFVAVEWMDFGGSRLWQSPDGRSWSQPGDVLTVPLDWINTMGAYGGDTVYVGSARGVPTVAWQRRGEWHEVDLAGLGFVDPQGNSWVNQSAVGPLGVFLVVQSYDEVRGTEEARLFHGVAPDDWTEVDLAGLMPGTGYISWIVIGTDQAVLRAEIWDAGPPLNLHIVGVPEA